MTVIRQKSDMSRRRLLKISAGLGVAAGLAPAAALAKTNSGVVRWRGVALGAMAEMQIAHGLMGRREAEVVLEKAVAELKRLEGIFSLYDESSDLVKLNAEGRLERPSPELVELLSTSLSLSRVTNGAFDPTVQPLWRFYETSRQDQPVPQSVLESVDYRRVDVSLQAIAFKAQGMEVTLNGIAQGFITDRIVRLLSEAGLENVLVDCGEVYGAGNHSEGRPWMVGIEGTDQRIACKDRAVATSSWMATVFDAAQTSHHLFDPRQGSAPKRYQRLAVVAPTATLADGLSTALSVLPEEAWASVLQNMSGANVEVIWMRKNGETIHRRV